MLFAIIDNHDIKWRIDNVQYLRIHIIRTSALLKNNAKDEIDKVQDYQ